MSQRQFHSSLVLILLSLAVVCAHPVLCLLFPAAVLQFSYAFFLGTNILALAACLWRAAKSPRSTRIKWCLIAAGFVFWLIADCMDAVTVLIDHAEPISATLKDFLYFFFAIPLLIIVSMPEEEEKSLPFFVFLDALQVLAIGYLAYAALFSVLPFSDKPGQPIPETAMNLVYDVENVVLTLLATARLAFGVRSIQDRRFFQVLVVYLWIYSVCLFGYNHLLGNGTTLGWLDVLVTIPFVLLILGALLVDRLPVFGTDKPTPHSISLTIDNARPILLSLTLVTLCAIVAVHHLEVAIAFTAGAFLIYGIRSIILQTHFQQTQIALEQARDRLAEIALQDGLTGLPNRRCFDQRFDSEWNRANRYHRPLSLMFIDADHFKNVNDTYGHLAGDECLRFLASALRSTLHRTGDIVARYGGEEFAMLLPETDFAGAEAIANNIRLILAENALPSAPTHPITVSIGITTWDGLDGISPEQILETADRALYLAKRNGRDRIESLKISSLVAK